jgi:hypothetical protein
VTPPARPPLVVTPQRLGTAVGAAVAVASVGALLLHAWYALVSGWYVDFVAGVWLGLARDLADGVFYRALASDAGFGGTRYFPLFFSLIAALLRVGVPALWAAVGVSVASAFVLVAGLAWLLAEMTVPRRTIVVLAILAIAPYFVLQAIFSVRCDLLALGLALCGLAAAYPLTVAARPSRSVAAQEVGPADVGRPPVRAGGRVFRPAAAIRLVLSALFLTLAFATKMTAIYAAGVAVLALLLAGHRMRAVSLALLVAAGVVIFAGVVQWASAGRAFESWRACALGGGTLGDVLRAAISLGYRPVAGSRLLSAVFLLAGLAWLIDLRAWKGLPSILLVACTGATAVILGSPGTVLFNQGIDLHVVSLVVLGAWVGRHRVFRFMVSAALVALLVVAAFQDVRRIDALGLRDAARTLPAERAELTALVLASPGRVLSENPEFPVFAGRRPYLLDPFAFRVVARSRPDVLDDLRRQLDARRFSCVLLFQDPEARGRGWYQHVDFGWPVIDRVLANYRYARTLARIRIYVPR